MHLKANNSLTVELDKIKYGSSKKHITKYQREFRTIENPIKSTKLPLDSVLKKYIGLLLAKSFHERNCL